MAQHGIERRSPSVGYLHQVTRRRSGTDPRQSCAPPRRSGRAMDHEPVLISTIAIGLTAAFIGGLIARRVRLPAIVGYIVAGVVIGPFTPGFIADTDIALELAELGVILLMFGVGIQFSIRELLAVRSIAVPGAIVQTIVSGLFGIWLGLGPRLEPGRRARPGARHLDRQHGRPAARAHRPQRARHAAGADRRRLADRRGPAGRPRARAAADDRPDPGPRARRPRPHAPGHARPRSPSPWPRPWRSRS